MQIQPGSTLQSVAGTARAAAKGGETDNQASEAAYRQSTAEKPAGKAAEAAGVEAGEQTQDRGGDGRQLYEQFPQRGASDDRESEDQDATEHDQNPLPPSGHLDFKA